MYSTMESTANTLSIWFAQHPFIMGAAFVWVIAWKGLALWKAAKKNDMWWFIALLMVNLLGILEILYYFVFSERKSLEKK